MFLGLTQISAKTYSQQISINEKNISLENVFKKIERQTGYNFVYDEKVDLLISRTIDVNVSKQSLGFVLDKYLRDFGISYKITRKTVSLKVADVPMVSKTVSIVPITGIIKDEKGGAMPGVSIKIKGSQKSVVTNSSGLFSIDAKPGDILLISYVGYQSKEVTIANDSDIQISLSPAVTSLESLVVVGYGTSRKNDVTGSISTVKIADVAKSPVARIDQALQGQIPGAQIIQNNGAPGSPISFFIRGAGTIGDADPLYVIDGVPTKVNISTLNMADIESISVLKDASSAAMYGSRAANGVVLINTKSGKSGKISIDLDAYYGLQKAWKQLDLLDASQWATVRNTALMNDGLPAVWDSNTLGKGTDWQDAVLHSAPIQSYNLSASGGNDKTSYFLSASNFKQDGIIRHSDYERNSLRANIRSTPTNYLSFGNNFNLSLISKNVVPSEIAGVLKNAIMAPPVIPVYRDGRFAGPTSAKEGSGANPLAQAADANSTDNLRRLTYSGFAQLEVLKNLKIKTSLGLDYNEQEQKTFNPVYAYDNYINTISRLYQNNSNTLDWLWENTVAYKATLFDNHNISVLAGTSAQRSKKRFTDILKTNFPGNSSNLQYLDNGTIVQANDVKGNIEEWALESYFGRVDYNFQDKYLLSANLRVDGSSRFGPSNRFGKFPSFAVGWNINKENFLKNVGFIDNLKLRASWGQLGNQDIGLYSFASTLYPYYTTFGQTPTAAPGYAPNSPPNPNVKWETTSQTDIGLELSVLQSRLTFEMDYYVKKTSDMLLQLPAPLSAGYPTTSFTNAGGVKNSGFEFSTNYRKNSGDLKYSLGANFSTYKNEVTSLGPLNQPIINGLFFDFATNSTVGHPLYQFYGYQMEGIFQNTAEIASHATQTGARPGDVKFRDLDNNGVIDVNDRTFLGSPFPKITYGFNANVSYKSFDFYLQLQGTQGNKIFNAARFWGLNVGETNNYNTDILNSWNGEGTSNEYPRLTTQDPNNNKRAVSRFIEDGSYMRIKNVQLGYTLSDELIKKIRLRSFRVYVGVNNLFTFTKYSGFDPEVGQALTATNNASGLVPNGSSFSRGSLGFDQISYPQARTITFGLQLGIL